MRTIYKILNLIRKPIITRASIFYLSPNNRLFGKKIIITGGGRGLGYSMAKKFLSEGADVLIAGRKEDVLKKSAEDLGCKYIVFDVTDMHGIEHFVEKADLLLGGANVLVNNAGISLHEGSIYNVSQDQFDLQLDTNLKSGYFLSKKFLELYSANDRKDGSILFLSSERGTYVDDIPYGLTKAALNSLTKGLARTHIRSNIRVNAVAPGVTATEMTGKSADNLYAGNKYAGRYYLPDEVAEVACFLISDAAACLSGQILTCDNGQSINIYKK